MTTNSTAPRLLTIILTATVVLALSNVSARAEISPRDQQALAKADLVYVATVRKNGTQSKAAPVWFTTGADNDSILIQTRPTTWKAKRIKRGSHVVLLWVGKEDGPALIGQAEITSNSEVQNKILKDFREKYWANRVMGVGPSRAKFDSGEVL